jgi:hypothetical protein
MLAALIAVVDHLAGPPAEIRTHGIHPRGGHPTQVLGGEAPDAALLLELFEAGLLPSLGAGCVLVGLHWPFAAIAFSDRFGTLVRGRTWVLVRDGEIDRGDLLGALRAEGLCGPAGVAEARLERSGGVSVVGAESEPRIPGIRLDGGTLTVRIRLE